MHEENGSKHFQMSKTPTLHQILEICPKKINNNTRLSPTAISCYCECQRKFFYIYIKEIKEKPTPDKVRGKIVHKVLENFFTFVDLIKIKEEKWQDLWKKFRSILLSLLESEWKQIGCAYENCFENDKQKTDYFDETLEFLDFYAIKLAFSLMNKMRELDKNSKWFEYNIKRFFYPKDRETKLELKDDGIVGFIDKTMSLFGDGIAIVDYKTSKCVLPHFIPNTHLIQGKAYAYLWKRVFNKLPKHISFYYLRTGETIYYKISDNDISEIENIITEIRNKNLDVSEFQKSKTKLCEFCEFKLFCFKDAESQSEQIT